jgi:hypothetical protein
MWDILNYTFIPFGNAYYPQSDCPGDTKYSRNFGVPCWQNKCGNQSTADDECFSGTIFCQHGDDECVANRMEGCAYEHYTPEQTGVFVYCLEDHEIDMSYAEPCAEYAGMDYDVLTTCSAEGSADGDMVDSHNGQLTAEFSFEYGQAWSGTPTVVLQGQVLFTTANLLQQVCKIAGDDAPAGCA